MKKVMHTENLYALEDMNKVLDFIKESGFDGYDFSMITIMKEQCFIFHDDYIKNAKKLKKHSDEIGLPCLQAHAPFRVYKYFDKKLRPLLYKYVKRAIRVASILGSQIIVIHPINDLSPEDNFKYLSHYTKVARKYNIKIAVENMWNWDRDNNHAIPASCSLPDNFIKTVDLLPNDVFGACLDIGHAEMIAETSAVELIHALNNRIICLHIHDNDKVRDQHLPIECGLGKIDYKKIAKALKEINYQGALVEEVDSGFEIGIKENTDRTYQGLIKLEKYMEE